MLQARNIPRLDFTIGSPRRAAGASSTGAHVGEGARNVNGDRVTAGENRQGAAVRQRRVCHILMAAKEPSRPVTISDRSVHGSCWIILWASKGSSRTGVRSLTWSIEPTIGNALSNGSSIRAWMAMIASSALMVVNGRS